MKIAAMMAVVSLAVGTALAEELPEAVEIAETNYTVKATSVWWASSCYITNGTITEARWDVDEVVKQMREQGEITNLVRRLSETGYVCSVIGHRWESVPHVTLEYRPDGDYPEHRKCSVCGKAQTKEPGAWR